MNARRVFCLVAVGVCLAPTALMAQTFNMPVRVKIVRGVTLTKTQDLAFGDIAPSASTSSAVSIASSTGARACGGGLTCVGAFQTAELKVIGALGESYIVTLPTTATIVSGPNSMTVDGFNISAANGTIGTFEPGGDDLLIGATLNIGAGQVSGVYTGAFDITVDY